MPTPLEIRDAQSCDTAALDTLYRDAFPDEDLVPLLHDLSKMDAGFISLIAVRDAAIIGHIGLTICTIRNGDEPVALLAPLAVTPTSQRTGIGSALIDAGFARMRAEGTARIFVLGDPAYYSRFGFVGETDISPPYPLPKEWAGAWQSISFGNAPGNRDKLGTLAVPAPWRCKELWG